jgi:hypothetical protein
MLHSALGRPDRIIAQHSQSEAAEKKRQKNNLAKYFHKKGLSPLHSMVLRIHHRAKMISPQSGTNMLNTGLRELTP